MMGPELSGVCVHVLWVVWLPEEGVWWLCLVRVPRRQAWSRERAPALLGRSDHPPITKPADGEGLRTDWHGLLSEMYSENNTDISEKTGSNE